MISQRYRAHARERDFRRAARAESGVHNKFNNRWVSSRARARSLKIYDKKYDNPSKAEMARVDKAKISRETSSREVPRVRESSRKFASMCGSQRWRFSLWPVIRVSDRKVRKCAYSLVAIEPKQLSRSCENRFAPGVDTLLRAAPRRSQLPSFSTSCSKYHRKSTTMQEYKNTSASCIWIPFVPRPWKHFYFPYEHGNSLFTSWRDKRI